MSRALKIAGGSLRLLLALVTLVVGASAAEVSPRERLDAAKAAVVKAEAALAQARDAQAQAKAAGDTQALSIAGQAAAMAEKALTRAKKTEVAAANAMCAEIRQQLARDQEAMRRQQKTIEMGQQELAEWSEKNQAAQQQALDHAMSFLVDSLLGGLAEVSDAKLNTIEAEFKKRAPLGETWSRKIRKIQEFESAAARLTVASNGLKITVAGKKAEEGWRAAKEWAAKSNKDAEVLDAILAEWRNDPELQQIMKEKGLAMFSASLAFSKTMSPIGTATDFAIFLADYGYDGKMWLESKARIEQQLANRDEDLKAVNALKLQIERTVAKLKECEARNQ